MRFPRISFCVLSLAGSMAVAAPPLHAVVLEFGNRFTRHGVFAAMPQDAIASVSGTVADGSSKPLPAAAVTVKNAAGVTQTARTDSKGKYWIGGLGADTYTITVRAKGYKNFEMAAHVIYECRTLQKSNPRSKEIRPRGFTLSRLCRLRRREQKPQPSRRCKRSR